MEWNTVQSTKKPSDIDTTSSKTVNYVRRNINKIQIEDTDGKQRTLYEYEELVVDKNMWSMHLELEQARADIDYLNMLTEDL